MPVLALFVSFSLGFLSSERQLPPYESMRRASSWAQQQKSMQNVYVWLHKNLFRRGRTKGRWNIPRTHQEAAGLTDRQRESLSELLSLGYLSGYEEASDLVNVTVHEPDLTFEGYNLYTSGHAQEAVLMDMEGKVLHKWSYEFRDAFPELPDPEGLPNLDYWRRVYLYENGDILAIYEGFGIIKLDKDSNLIWANSRRCHHDLFLDENAIIYVLSKEAKIVPRIHEYELIVDDFITIIDPEGNVVRNVSILEAFEKSSYASFLRSGPKYGELFHTNTIEVFDGSSSHRSPYFKNGNVLISILKTSVIAILDMEQEKIVWALAGQWVGQHQPTLLENGNILLLDNYGHRHSMSKVVEINPFTQEIIWAYEGTLENVFSTKTLGSNQRLPNGNTLITESDSGRAFEVTPDKRIVWEYHNPARSGANNELVASLFEVIRLEAEYPMNWLNR
jgi:hypothetical protein